MSTPYGLPEVIFPQHAAMLEASAISPAVAKERGYVSVGEKSRLASAGFRHYQRLVPGLLIPVHDASGAVATWQYRPDHPRQTKPDKAGKTRVIKYETPGGSRLVLDVPPGIRSQLGDPSVPLWITEGARKADAAVSAGVACIALSGVDGWQGTNVQGGKTALCDWKDMALNGRRVYLAFDSDAASNPKVAAALQRLGDWLSQHGACSSDVRYCYLPAGDDGRKVGLDDYLAAGGSIDALIGASTPKLMLPVQTEMGDDPPPAAKASATRATATTVAWDGDLAGLLDKAHAALTKYVVFPCPEAADAAVLYAATTHAQHELQFAARLNIRSPHKRCGKSRLMDLLALLVRNPLLTVDISAAALVRSITEEDPPTILLDEADVTFGKNVKGDEKAEHLRGIFNAGFERGRPYTRWDITTRQPEKCPTFSMAIIAGIGRLPDTIEDRSIIITLRRKAPHEKADKFRRRHKADVENLGACLAARVAPHAKQLGDAEPVMPDGLNDRAEDTWEALIALADLAGGTWPERAAAAARVLSAEAEENEGDSWQMRLLADLRGIFGDADALHGQTILNELHKVEESPWADYYGKPLAARGLADLLRPYGIRSKDVKIDGVTRKGYRRADLWDTWQRYPAATSATSATSQVRQVADENQYPLPPLPGSGGSGYPIRSATTLSSQDAEVAEVAATSPETLESACTVCSQPLDPANLKAGFTTHPMCGAEAGQ